MGITFNTPIILSDVDAHGLKFAGKLGSGQIRGIDALAIAAAADAVDSDESQFETGAEAELILVPGGMRRGHDKLKGKTLSVEPTTGEKHLRHHVSPDGFYRGKQVIATEALDADDE